VATCVGIGLSHTPRFGSFARRTDGADPQWTRQESFALSSSALPEQKTHHAPKGRIRPNHGGFLNTTRPVRLQTNRLARLAHRSRTTKRWCPAEVSPHAPQENDSLRR